MDKRFILSRIIRAMLILLVLAFVFVLFRSLSGPAISSSSNNSAFDNVVIGQTASRRFGRERVFVTRLSQAQRRQAAELDALVVDSQSGCRRLLELCVLSSKSRRDGIDIVYSATAPAQLPGGVVWYGGFVDPVSGGVFDFLGRAYKGVRSKEQRSSLNLVDMN